MKKPIGKAKGSQFERDMARKLSLWLSKGERADLLWRSAMSGGRATLSMRKGEKLSSQSGDLSSIDKLSHDFIDKFYVELKFYKKLDIEALLKNTGGRLYQFWNVVKEESGKYSKLPFLVAKQNFMPILLCLDSRGVDYFQSRNHDSLLVIVPRLDLFVYNFESFTVGIEMR